MKNKLLNPFEYYGERQLFWVGVIAFVCMAVYTNYTHLMFLGSLKVIFAPIQPLYYSFVNLAITLIVNVIVLFVYAIVRNSRSRFVDVLNTVLIAHIWLYFVAIITGLTVVTKFLKSFELLALDHMNDPSGLPIGVMLGILLFAILAIGTMICFFVYILKGIRIATNRKTVGDSVFVITIVLVVNTLIQYFNPYL